jgi:hypothetical protein
MLRPSTSPTTAATAAAAATATTATTATRTAATRRPRSPATRPASGHRIAAGRAPGTIHLGLPSRAVATEGTVA